MTAPSDAAPRDRDPDSRRRRAVRRVLGRAALHTVVLLGAYYLLPLRGNEPALVVRLIGSVGLMLFVLVWQVRAVLRAEFPFVQGLIGLSLAVPLMVVLYAGSYYALSVDDASAFTEPLGRTDALYFAVTTFATVGYGNIAPVSQPARVLAMTQMVADVVIIGFAVNTVFDLKGASRPSEGGGQRSSVG